MGGFGNLGERINSEILHDRISEQARSMVYSAETLRQRYKRNKPSKMATFVATYKTCVVSDLRRLIELGNFPRSCPGYPDPYSIRNEFSAAPL